MNKINRHDGTPTPVSQPGGPPSEEGTNVRPTLSQSISNIIWGRGDDLPVLLLPLPLAAAPRWSLDSPKTGPRKVLKGDSRLQQDTFQTRWHP